MTQRHPQPVLESAPPCPEALTLDDIRAHLFPQLLAQAEDGVAAPERASAPWTRIGLLNEEHPDAFIQLENVNATPSDVGAAAHALIGLLVPVVDALAPAAVVETCLALARACCAPGRMRIANSVRVAGYAIEYLNGPCRPRSPWVCLGVEFETGGGRVDVAWRSDVDGTVFYDEIKTTRTARRSPDQGWVQQCARYAASGTRLHGSQFLGVRLLPLGSLGASRLVQPDCSVVAWDATAVPTGQGR